MGDPLVSVGFPVRNGERSVENVIESVLAQSHPHIELLISDNASTDATEDICREIADRDERVVYHRQKENVGITRNFQTAIDLATGQFFRWIGDGDWLAPTYVSRLLGPLVEDEELLLMTSGIEYTLDDDSTTITVYEGDHLGSPDAADRFVEVLRFCAEGFASGPDPLYALMRRGPVAAIPRRNMLREDEVFAAKLALAGRWGHDEAILAGRHWSHDRASVIARRLQVPRRQALTVWTQQAAELARVIAVSDLDARQRRRTRAAVARLYLQRHQRWVERGVRKAARPLSSRPR